MHPAVLRLSSLLIISAAPLQSTDSVGAAIIKAVVVQPIDARTRAELHARDWRIRANALEKIRKIDSPEARKLLIELLKYEVKTIDEAYDEGIGAEYKYGEEYVAYTADVQDLVTENYKRHQDPEALRLLVHSPYNPGSVFAYWIAEQGPVIAPELLEMAREPGFSPDRENAIAVLGHMLAWSRGQKQPLSPSLSASIHDSIVLAARELNNAGIRSTASEALGEGGDARDLPLLKKIATEDPYVLPPPLLPRYTVREAAQKAIERIQKRLASNNPSAK